jgi:hypothetical protein
MGLALAHFVIYGIFFPGSLDSSTTGWTFLSAGETRLAVWMDSIRHLIDLKSFFGAKVNIQHGMKFNLLSHRMLHRRLNSTHTHRSIDFIPSRACGSSRDKTQCGNFLTFISNSIWNIKILYSYRLNSNFWLLFVSIPLSRLGINKGK